MKKLEHFVVLVGGRLVDCFKAKDIVTAFDIAIGKWAGNVKRASKEGSMNMIEVAPLPERMPKVVISATTKEVLEFGQSESRSEGVSYLNWPYGSVSANAEL